MQTTCEGGERFGGAYQRYLADSSLLLLLLLLTLTGGDGDVEGDDLLGPGLLLLPVDSLGVIGPGHLEGALALTDGGCLHVGHGELLLGVALLLGFLLALVAVTELLLLVLLLTLFLLGGLLLTLLFGAGLAGEDLDLNDISAASLVDGPSETLGTVVRDLEEHGLANSHLETVLLETSEGLVEVGDLNGSLLNSGLLLLVATGEDQVKNNTDNEHAGDDHNQDPSLHLILLFSKINYKSLLPAHNHYSHPSINNPLK